MSNARTSSGKRSDATVTTLEQSYRDPLVMFGEVKVRPKAETLYDLAMVLALMLTYVGREKDRSCQTCYFRQRPINVGNL